MPLVSPQELQKLQGNQNKIRNICIVAHVDHGKTTIADTLISTNGIISHRSAGKLRYMDNTAYEQARGITVKSSCISLQYTRPETKWDKAVEDKTQEQARNSYLINLIDSPGHMDFSGEVSSALRMTDGCFLVVDAVEGVCIQTRAVLRQAWNEKVRPTLVINKIDKLFSNLHLGPEEAYRQLLRVVEQVNQVLGELWIEQQILDADSAHLARMSAGAAAVDSEAAEDITIDVDSATDSTMAPEKLLTSSEEDFEFNPILGNVVFVSAMHGWGFSLEDFVDMYASKLKMNRRILRQTLWGEYYYNPKNRKIVTRRPATTSAQTMFASLILSNIHQIYTAILGSVDDMSNAASHKGYSSLTHRDNAKLERIDKALNLNVPPREFKNEDVNVAISAFMNRWLPISATLLELAITLPSPRAAQPERISILWHKSTHDMSPAGLQQQHALQQALCSADASPSAPVIAYVSKVFAVPNEQFPKSSRYSLEAGRKTLIAMARLFSGTLKAGDEVRILNARYNPAHPEKHVTVAKIPQLWLLMGPDLHPIDSVSAGTVFGIGAEYLDVLLAATSSAVHTPIMLTSSSDQVTSKDETGSATSADNQVVSPQRTSPKIITSEERNAFVSHIVKTATLTNVLACPAFGALTKHVNPIVRVAVEPQLPSDLQALEAGMWLLHQADAAVHVEVQENGEFIIGALGELHLARCLELLRDDFAKIPIKVSPPVVSFRETILPGLAIDPDTKAVAPTELVIERTTDRQVSIVLRAVRLPENVTSWLETHADDTRVVHQISQGIQQQGAQDSQVADAPLVGQEGVQNVGADLISKWVESLRAEFQACESKDWQQQADFVWALGPHRIGPNVLLNNIPKYSTSKYWRGLLSTSKSSVPTLCCPHDMASNAETSASEYSAESLTWFGILQQLDAALRSGFQNGVRAGPLCEEPLMGVAIQVLDVNISYTPRPVEETPTVAAASFLLGEPSLASSPSANDIGLKQQLSEGSHGGFGETLSIDQLNALWTQAASLAGATIAATRSAIRRAIAARPQRLYEALYLAHVQVNAVNMGKAYGVLNKRRGDIISDEVNESSGLTLVVAMLPAAEAFGFSEELVGKSGGAANAQLTFAKWRELDVDPNFVPTTEEELEEFGDHVGGIAPNLARTYVDGVRKRKGLALRVKLVEKADKQRTLSKKK